MKKHLPLLVLLIFVIYALVSSYYSTLVVNAVPLEISEVKSE